MSGTRIFIAILFVIGIAFVVGINLGAIHTDDQTFKTPDWLGKLGEIVAHPQSLKIADITPVSTSCLQQEKFILPLNTTCAFTIKKATFTQRTIKLRLVQGTNAMVTLFQEDTLTVQESIAANATTKDDLEVYPGKAQGMLTLQCKGSEGGVPCIFELQ